jgi:hypothetical protein
MTIRDDLIGAIAAVVDTKKVHVIPYQDNIDVPDRTTIMFKQLSLRPLEQAPRAAYRVDYVLTVISAATDPAVAEEELDAFVPSLLGDLDALDWFAWDTADKVIFQSSSIAYDVTCYNIARRKVQP